MSDTPPTPEPKAAHVIEALCRVMRDLPGIGKDAESEQGYFYRGIESITREAQHLLARHGVVFVPKVIGRTVKDLTINSRPWTEDHAEVVYRCYGPGGAEDFIDVGPLWGLGRDNSDKGMNKAMTQAFKYALTQTLCIGDGKDDADRDVAHEADPHVEAPADPHWQARGAVVDAIKALPGDARDRMRQWMDDNSVPRLPAQWTPEHLDVLPAIVARHAESPPEAPQDGQEAPQAPEGGTDTPDPGSAPESPQERPSDGPVVPEPHDNLPAVLAWAEAVTVHDTASALAERGLSTTGNASTLHTRLAKALVKEGFVPPSE